MIEASKNHAKFYLKAHIVLVSKYRRNIFVNNFDNILISYLKSLSLNYNFKIDNINTDLNHVHIFKEAIDVENIHMSKKFWEILINDTNEIL